MSPEAVPTGTAPTGTVPTGTPATGTARLSLATVCLSGTLEDKLAAAATAGFDGVEIFAPDLLADPGSPAAIGARCRDLGDGRYEIGGQLECVVREDGVAQPITEAPDIKAA